MGIFTDFNEYCTQFKNRVYDKLSKAVEVSHMTPEEVAYHIGEMYAPSKTVHLCSNVKQDVFQIKTIVETFKKGFGQSAKLTFGISLVNDKEGALGIVSDITKVKNNGDLIYLSLSENLLDDVVAIADSYHFDFFFQNNAGELKMYKHECKKPKKELGEILAQFFGVNPEKPAPSATAPSRAEFETSIDKLCLDVKGLIKQAVNDEDINNFQANIPVVFNSLKMSSVNDYTQIYQTLASACNGTVVAYGMDQFDYVVFVDGYEIRICSIVPDENSIHGKVGRVFQMSTDDFEEVLFLKDGPQLIGATIKQIGSWI